MKRLTILASGLLLMLSGTVIVGFGTGQEKPVARSYPSLSPSGSNDDKRSIFISGHSLTDRPMPDLLASIAENAGLPLDWNMQHIGGSSVKQRLAGADTPSGAAVNRDGQPINVRQELLHPAAHPEKPYDILLITEQHRLLDSLLWQDSIRSLRAYQDTFIEANAEGTSYLFVPWLDLSDPQDWIAYERDAWPIWQCVVSSVNDGLAADGRNDRLYMVPASLALADLVDHLLRAPDKAGFERMTAKESIATLFADGVHLTPLGNYYIAAVTFRAIYGRAIPDVAPPGLDAIKAQTLRTFAEGFITSYRQDFPEFGGACNQAVPIGFALKYGAYIERIYDRPEAGILMSRLHQFRNTMRYSWRLRDVFSTTAMP